jgi:hypothetical protein
MVWATSVTATGLLLLRERLGAVLSSIDAVERGDEAKRRRARDRTSEVAMWRAHWSSDALYPSARLHHAETLLLWVLPGWPVLVVVAALSLGLESLLGAGWPLSLSAVVMSTVILSIVTNAVLWVVTPERWPTRLDRVLSGWPQELAVLAVAVWWVFH